MPHLLAVHRFALHLTRDPAAAHDLTQECFHQAFRKFYQFTNGTNCKAWLFQIARNAYIDELRQRSRQPRPSALGDVVADADGDGAAGSSLLGTDGKGGELLRWHALSSNGERVLSELFGDEVNRSLRELPDEFRLAVLLCDVESFSYKEIAEILDCPVGTVRSRISRARNFLKEKLFDYARNLGFVRKSES